MALVAVFSPFAVKAETTANTCVLALSAKADFIADDEFQRKALMRSLNIKNLGEAIWCGGIKGGWYSSSRGLRSEGQKLFGSPWGGQAARVIYKYQKEFNFIMDDQRLAETGSDAGGLADGATIVLPSSFLEKPNMGTLKHEITHVINNAKNDLSHLIYFEIYDADLGDAIGGTLYNEGFRADEVEARIAELDYDKARLSQINLREAWIFADRQREYIDSFLKDIPSFYIRKTMLKNGKESLVVRLREYPIDRDKAPEFPSWVRHIAKPVLWIPVPNSWPKNYDEQEQLVREILMRRLEQLDALKSLLDPVEEAAKMRPQKQK